MTTSSNSNTTLLLVTGLLSVGMAAIGYYYLQINSKKPCTLTDDSSEAGVHNSQKTSTTATVTEEEKIARVKSMGSDIQTGGAGTFSSSASRTTGKTIVASVSETIEKTVAIKMPMLPPVSPKKALESSKKTMEKVDEPLVKVVESSVIVEASKEVILCPKTTTQSSLMKTAENPKKEIESPVLVVSKPFNTSRTPTEIVENHKQTIENQNKAPETPKKVVKQDEAVTTESPKKAVEKIEQSTESIEKVVKQTEASNIEHSKQASASPSKKKNAGPEKSTELASHTEKLKIVTSKLSEDLIVAQAVAETASAFADKTLQEMLENIALEQDYVQVDLTQSMTLSQSTPELLNTEDAEANTEEIVPTSATTEDEESIVKEEQEQEQEEEEDHAQVLSVQSDLKEIVAGPIKSAIAEPVVDTAATTETLAAPTTPDTTPVSWEAIILSPEMEATPAQEPTTPLSLDALVESTEFTEPLSINVPAENTKEPDKSASSPVDSGGSTPGKRNRNRSKKSKSKKKKGKKH